jgi:hypothetical protein
MNVRGYSNPHRIEGDRGFKSSSDSANDRAHTHPLIFAKFAKLFCLTGEGDLAEQVGIGWFHKMGSDNGHYREQPG